MEYVVHRGSGSYLQRLFSITEMIAKKMRLPSKWFPDRHRRKSGHEAGRETNVGKSQLIKLMRESATRICRGLTLERMWRYP